MTSKLLSSTIIRYIIAGGLSYAIEMLAIYGMIFIFHLSSVAAVAIAFWIGLTASFLLQKIFAFSSLSFSKKNMAKQITVYLLLVFVNYLFTLSVVSTFSQIEVGATRTAALIITTLWNYFIFKYILFKQ